MSKEGNLIVKPLTAKLTHNTETFGTMDPYCKVIVGQNFSQTNVHNNGGKNPGWNMSLTFRITNEDLISVEVWDKDDASKNDLIGSGSLAISKITSNKNKFSDWVPLTYKGKSAGSVLLDIEYFPDGGNKSNTTTTTSNQQYTNLQGGYNMSYGMNMQTNYQPIYQQQQQQFIQQQPIYTTTNTNMVYQQPLYTNTNQQQQVFYTNSNQQQQYIQQQPIYTTTNTNQQQYIQQQPNYSTQQVVYTTTNNNQQQQYIQQQPIYSNTNQQQQQYIQQQPNIQYQQQQQYPNQGNININLGGFK